MRKLYIDNLRWNAIVVLIVYHAAMAWNTWNEPNYMMFEGNRLLSSIVVILSPFLMPLLFVLAGISTRFALKKRTVGEYLLERSRKLLIPFVLGTIILMPVMTFVADFYNCHYTGSFKSHYKVFFTKFTDLTGADGGFSVGQFWFLLYLFAISLLFLGIRWVQRKIRPEAEVKGINALVLCLLGLPVLPFHEYLNVGGKSILEYLYLFILGYYLFSEENVINKVSIYRWIFFAIGAVATIVNTYLFIWMDSQAEAVQIVNTVTRSAAEWFMLLGVMGLANRYFDKEGRLTKHMTEISFAFYILHYVWVVLFQLKFSSVLYNKTFYLFLVPVVLAYVVTLILCDAYVWIRGFVNLVKR